MTGKRFSTILLITLFFFSSAFADDILRVTGAPNKRVTIQSVTYETIQFKSPTINMTQKTDASVVEKIVYTAAPGLKTAYSLLANGMYTEAEAKFKRVTGKDFIDEESDFGVAFVAYQRFQDTGKQGDKAVSQLEKYLSEYRPKKGFHLPYALYILGRTYIGTKALDKAAASFTELQGISGETREILAEIGKGELAMAKGSYGEASTSFNALLKRTKSNRFEKLYKQVAACRGRALVAEKRYDDAIDFLTRETQSKKDEEVEFDNFTAQAFNALASAYAAKGDKDNLWKALYNYLWTTKIYRHCRAESAEAFYNAILIARKLGETADAAKLKYTLKNLYSGTKWLEKVN